MQRFYRVEYRRDKNDSPGTLIERIAAAVHDAGSADHAISFSFSEPFIPGTRSTIDYLIKTYSVFEPYRVTSDHSRGMGASFVTDMIPDTVERPRVPVATLIDVARGIPRRFPFGNASFIWHDVAALDMHPESALPDNTAAGFHGRLIGRVGEPGIYVHSAWGASKRSLTVTAIARLDPGGRVTKKPVLPEPMRRLLEAIGRIKTGDVFVLPDVGEAADDTKAALLHVEEVFRHARDSFASRLSSLPLEDIRYPARGETVPENPGSVKEPAAQALAPLSYASLPAAGARGYIVFGKPVDNRRELRVNIDHGTWSHHFHARFEIRSERWVRSMVIPLSATLPMHQYQQIDQEHIRRLCANLAIVVREIEAYVYPQVAQALDEIENA